MDYKTLLGILAPIVGIAGYVPYLRDVFNKKTKPHAFSWLAWGILEVVAFFAQVTKGAGVGALVTGVSALVTLLIAVVAFTRKETEIKFTDVVAFSGSIIGIILWTVTKDPLIAVILITVSDALAFIPTFRKSFFQPQHETLIEYCLSVAKWTVGILALRNYNLTTWLYPASLVVTNGSFVVMSVIRKRIINSEKNNYGIAE